MEPFQIRYAFVSSVQSVQRPHLVDEDLRTRFLPEGALKYRPQVCVGNRDRFGGFVRIQRESIVIIRHAVVVVVPVRVVGNAVAVCIDRGRCGLSPTVAGS